MKHILVTDDDQINLAMAKHALQGSYEVSTASSGEEALLWLEDHTADMIIMDIEMGELDGIEAVKLIKEDARWSHIPVIFLTSSVGPQVEIKCLQTGADDFITKPFVPMVMKSRVDKIMELYELRFGLERELYKKTKQVEMVTMHSIMSIANTIDAKDKYTSGHSIRVARCSVAIAKRMGWSEEELQNLQYVALLHDIGKIGVPDAVLNKPSKLTDEEFAIIKKHPVIGGEILKEIYTIPHVREGALFHHERYDGGGYPYGLAGKDIPLFARIVCLADTYDAMSTNRVYRKMVPHEEIIEEYERCSGTQFDPELAKVFIEMLKGGSIVGGAPVKEELRNTGEIMLDSVLREGMEEAANIFTTDTLTRFNNKTYAQSHVDELLKSGHKGALFMMNIDDFKHINDVYGHIIGDRILKIYADVIRNAAVEGDILCRVGGDEFLMFAVDMVDKEEAGKRAAEIIEALAANMAESNMSEDVFTSIGIAIYQAGDDFLTMYKKADRALYFTKRNGKNAYHFFENDRDEEEDGANNADIGNIRSIVTGGMDISQGAFNLAYGEFQKIYNFIARYVDRSDADTLILLLTVKNRRMGLADMSEQEEVMAELKNAISGSLRKSDVYTRYSSSQYIVVLVNDAGEDSGVIIERIMKNFYKLHRNDAFYIKSDVCRLSENQR